MKIKKLLSAVLICMMVVCSFTMVASAMSWEDLVGDINDQLANGDSADVTLENDVTAPSSYESLAEIQAIIDESAEEGNINDITITAPITVPAGEEFTLDLKGSTIRMSEECTAHTAMITNNGTLTIEDSVGGGKISFKDTGAGDPNFGWGSYTIYNNGTLTVNGGTIENTTPAMAHAYYAINAYSGSETTINGGEVVCETSRAIRIFTADENETKFTTNGGTVTGTIALYVQLAGDNDVISPIVDVNINDGTFVGTDNTYGMAIYSYSNGNGPENVELNIAGGIFEGSVAVGVIADKSEKVNVTGGTFNGDYGVFNYNQIQDAITITGGTFATDYSSWWAEDDGYVFEDNGDGTFGAVEEAIEGEAAIDGEGFATLAEAVAAAEAGDTITLLTDVTMSDILVINKAIVLDGNGKTLTSTAGRAINVSGAAGVTIKNLTINASGERAINVIQNATDVTIDNVTATAANYTVNLAASAPNAVVAISNSTLDGLCTVNVSAAGAYVTVDNSTVNCNDNNTTVGEAYAALSLNKDAVGGSIIATNTTINVPADSDSTATRNGAENGTVTVDGSAEDVTTMVAVITYPGSDYYHSFTTLAKAVEFAKSGDTITLISDITLDAPLTIAKGKEVALDLNGKTVVYNSTVMGEAMITNKGTLTIADTVGTGVINYNYTGTADPSYGTGNYTISNAGTLTVNGGKITIANLRSHAKYPIDNNSTTGDAILVINGGHLYNYNTSAIRQFCNSTTNANSVTINGGLIEGYSAIWVQNPGKNTVNGSLSITGGEVKTTAAAYVNGTAELKDVSSGIYCTISGEGGAWDGESAISITGGTINENVKLSTNAPADITVEGGATFNGRVEVPVVEEPEEKLDTVIAFIKKPYTYTDEKTGEEKNVYKVSILAGIDSLNYRRVGFEFTCGSEISATLDTKKVYTDFTAAGTKHNPDRFGADCEYIFAVTGGLPANGEKIVARAFAETLDGNYIYSDYYASSELN